MTIIRYNSSPTYLNKETWEEFLKEFSHLFGLLEREKAASLETDRIALKHPSAVVNDPTRRLFGEAEQSMDEAVQSFFHF